MVHYHGCELFKLKIELIDIELIVIELIVIELIDTELIVIEWINLKLHSVVCRFLLSLFATKFVYY